MFALVDDVDVQKVLAAGAWSMHRKGYAACRKILMHRLVMDASKDVQIDHRNRNKLDNRRGNLRVATDTQQRANTKRYASNTSGYKGVSHNRANRTKRWRAYIAGKHLGVFHAAEEAGRAYDAAATELYGEFAVLNFPREAP